MRISLFLLIFPFALMQFTALFGQKPLHENLFNHAKSAPDSVENNFQDLATYLKSAAQNDKEIAETIFYWMALNIEYIDDPAYQSDITTEEIALVTLQTKKSGCEGTARLFYELCTASQLECEVIFGYALGYSYDNNKAARPNHGWNAVKINDKWELVDATWGSGGSTSEDGKEVYITELDLRYLFADPKNFVIDHFPQQARWQLMEKPISKRKFFSDEYDMRRMGKLVKYSK
ncbi:MAG: hypothetical protein HGA23_11035 [Bacteroidales bacterium]|nr:hypothetical protein [Bacteroidales bacterium]